MKTFCSFYYCIVADEVISTVVTIYKRSYPGILPTDEEVLFCTAETSADEVVIQLRNAKSIMKKHIFVYAQFIYFSPKFGGTMLPSLSYSVNLEGYN